MDNNEALGNEMDTTAILQDLLRTEWVEEAKQIPIFDLPQDEQELLIKCINKAEMSEKEIEDLGSLLSRFRKPIREQKPNEIIENVKNNIEYTKNVKDYIEILKNSKKSEIYPIMYPISDTEEEEIPILIETELTPTATQLIANLQSSLDAFVDFTQEEAQTFNDYQNGVAQSPEEVLIAKKVEKEVMKLGATKYTDVKDTAIKFLAEQTRIAYDSECTYEDMLNFYGAMKQNILMAMFEEIQEIVGVNNVNRDKLFRKFS